MPDMGDLPINVVDAICAAGPVGRFWASAMRCGALASVELPSVVTSTSFSGYKHAQTSPSPALTPSSASTTPSNRATRPPPRSLCRGTEPSSHKTSRGDTINSHDGCSNIDQTLANTTSTLQDTIAFHPTASLTPQVVDAALREAKWDVIRYLHDHPSTVGCTTDGMDCYGHLDVARFLHEQRSEGCTVLAMDLAACRGHLEVVQFLHNNRTEGCSTNAMDLAACCGHLEIIQFLHEKRSEGCTTLAMDAAAGSGRLDIVQFLCWNRSEGCTDEALASAYQGDHADVAKFLQDGQHNNSDHVKVGGCFREAMHHPPQSCWRSN